LIERVVVTGVRVFAEMTTGLGVTVCPLPALPALPAAPSEP
jgi:hypothetical protein